MQPTHELAACSDNSLLNKFESQRQPGSVCTVSCTSPITPLSLSRSLSLARSLALSLCLSLSLVLSDPISQWNHQGLIPICVLAGGPVQHQVHLKSPVNSQPFSLRVLSPLRQPPSSTLTPPPPSPSSTLPPPPPSLSLSPLLHPHPSSTLAPRQTDKPVGQPPRQTDRQTSLSAPQTDRQTSQSASQTDRPVCQPPRQTDRPVGQPLRQTDQSVSPPNHHPAIERRSRPDHQWTCIVH